MDANVNSSPIQVFTPTFRFMPSLALYSQINMAFQTNIMFIFTSGLSLCKVAFPCMSSYFYWNIPNDVDEEKQN